jgi:hypothetical protein
LPSKLALSTRQTKASRAEFLLGGEPPGLPPPWTISMKFLLGK